MTNPAEAVAETKEEKEKVQYIEDLTQNCDELQKNVLEEILTQNANTGYLKRFGLEGAADRQTFKSKVPVVTYEDILPDIQRIANGDFSPILCAQPITEFYASSGTSGGESKLIPATAEYRDRRMQFHNIYMPILNRYIPGLNKGKALNFLFIKEETTTPGGLVVRTFVTSVCKTYMPRNASRTTSPVEAILCLDSFQSMYTQMLCGLYSRDQVNRIGAVFASSLLRVIRFLQDHYTDLCNDISTGILNSKVTDTDIRACMAKIMRPDPELAGFINHECRDENWEGIIRRIWPNTKYLDVIVTGSMAQYIPTLDYYSGGLPKVTSFYGCSECIIGFNLNPLCDPSEICYTIIPTMAYFEFIPIDDDSSDNCNSSALQLVDLADVEVGNEYEIVVTTYAGLYRYRVGDVIQVTGFHNSTPKVKFARRKNVLLSIDVDKTNESDLQKAIENASALLQPFNTSIIEYTSYADTKTIPGHYLIYLELSAKGPKNGPSQDVLEECCLEMEETLDTIYRQGRHLKSIGPLEIRVVKNGTFEALMDYAITRGASINQFKMPRCVKLEPMVELLDSNIVSTHFSPSLPHWSP